jgi:hypothetical protein
MAEDVSSRITRWGTWLLLLFLCSFSSGLSAQGSNPCGRKGQVYGFWGWNRGWFTHSDIAFRGNDYDFTLHHLTAHDRQTPFNVRTYFGITRLTLPQTNCRIGYFFRDNWEISAGLDHMKYVVDQGQTAKMDGYIHEPGKAYTGDYHAADVLIQPGFLRFEHTDGLNYLNAEVRRSVDLMHWLAPGFRKNIRINVMAGAGTGVLLPKTNCTLLGNPRHDDFHLSGFALHGVAAARFTFFKHAFIQTDLKSGWIAMPDIRTTVLHSDRASQKFFFVESVIAVGGNFQLWGERCRIPADDIREASR